MDQIYILPMKLWCDIAAENERKIEFYVINGAWKGSLENGNLFVEATSETCGNQTVVWRGKAPFGNADYNRAIEWIEEQIAA